MRLVSAAIERDGQDIVIEMALISKDVAVPCLSVGKRRTLRASRDADELVHQIKAHGAVVVGCLRTLAIESCYLDATRPF